MADRMPAARGAVVASRQRMTSDNVSPHCSSGAALHRIPERAGKELNSRTNRTFRSARYAASTAWVWALGVIRRRENSYTLFVRRTPETKFGRISEQAKAEAAQADVLAEIFTQLPTYFDRRRPVALLSPETVFLEHFDEPNEYWQWLSPVLFEYLRQDSEFNLLTGRSLVYRYVFLPVPELVGNWSRRRRLMKAILLTLHVHLWFGVICGIYFVNQQRVDVSELVSVANFLQLPRAKVLFDAPGFHSAASIDLRRIDGATARTRPNEAWKRLGVDRQKPMWLFYDEDTYGGEKLHSWRLAGLQAVLLARVSPCEMFWLRSRTREVRAGSHRSARQKAPADVGELSASL
jgi:hypothetical protein